MKRIYSDTALEFWLSRLSENWEQNFSSAVLAQGRSIYRKSLIKAIELSDSDAIIYAKINDLDGYVVVDWSNARPDIRASMTSDGIGKALAIAGLYEIEELVSEEVSPLPEERSAPLPGPEDSPQMEVDRPLPILQEPEEKMIKETPVGPVANLVLRFSVTESNLIFRAYWQIDEDQLVSASCENLEAVEDMAYARREQWIRLASLIRKHGFKYNPRTGAYVLEDLEQAPYFINHEVEKWRTYFSINLDNEIETLKLGIRDVELIAKADCREEDNFEIAWHLQLDNDYLESEWSNRFIKRRNLPTFLPGRGIVRIPKEQAAVILDWEEQTHAITSASLPRYLLFSLFNRLNANLILSPKLSAWRTELETIRQTAEVKNEQLDFLRSYQQMGVHWLGNVFKSGCHALLADEMGLGKTLQVLSLMVTHPIVDKPSLIVCPASVIPVWLGEIEHFFPKLQAVVVNKRFQLSDHEPASTDTQPSIWICSYTQLRQRKSILSRVSFGYAVLDEAQFIKNPEAKVTIACLQLEAQYRLALTGTPLENKFLDLWTLFRFLMPGLLGGKRKFAQQLREDEQKTMQRVRAQIAPFVLRRTKQDVAKELLPKVCNELVCPLTDLQITEYRRLVHQAKDTFGRELTFKNAGSNFNLLSLLTRLRQCCCDPGLLPSVTAHWRQSGKITVLIDKLQEIILNSHKVVIFSQFVQLLSRVQAALDDSFEGCPVYRLTGQTKDRKVPVEAFQKTTGSAIMLISLRAGGTGITLNTADYVFLLDPWWNPAVEEQAIDRVHRMGQRGTVFVYHMITPGTLEMRIQKLKMEKRTLFEEAFGKFSDKHQIYNYFDSLEALIELKG